jgi:nicotinate-nucleotide--dimethylbenzimidazole phosphoribosyltransferase
MIDETAVWAHLDALAKPQKSLGRLEVLAVRLATIQNSLNPVTRPRRIVLFAADHGVVAQGVSAWPQEVTGLMVQAICSGRASSSALAAAQDCDLRIVDVGVMRPPAPPHPQFYSRVSIAPGTADLSTTAAMSPVQFEAAWAIGVGEAKRAAEAGCLVLLAGEMGIGNTTSAACLISLLTQAAPEDVVGRGAGIDDTALAAKTQIVKIATKRATELLTFDTRAAIASVAGFEIAAMAGFFAQGATQGSTLLLDGYVATSAALVAERLAPGTRHALIAAHRSAEPGHDATLAALGLQPLLDWQMRLGEGTGALVALPLLDSAAALLCDVAPLSDVGI